MKENKSLRENIYNKILEKITNGEISPGEKLNERQIAKEFSVSRTPVREAFAQLEKMGIVVSNLRTGTVVKKTTVEQFEEISEIVSVLEAYAIEIAVEKGVKKKDLAYIKRLHQEMKKSVEEKNYLQYTKTNITFHEFLVKISGNKALAEALKDLIRRVYIGGLSLPFYVDKYISQHTEIIHAISSKLPLRAGAMMRAHDEYVKKFKAEALRNLKKNHHSFTKRAYKIFR